MSIISGALLVYSLRIVASQTKNSPHFPHIRTGITDYYIHYRPAGQRAALYDWSAAHFDWVLSDSGVYPKSSIGEYKRRNPNIKWFDYMLFHETMDDSGKDPPSLQNRFYTDMEHWLKAHGYEPEQAYIHDASASELNAGCPSPQPVTKACRHRYHQWSTYYWALNPGYVGVKEYNRDRVSRIIHKLFAPYSPDGIFLDVACALCMSAALFDPTNADYLVTTDRRSPTPLREYDLSNSQGYINDMVSDIAYAQAAINPKPLMPNTAHYTSSNDFALVSAAKAASLEGLNNPDGRNVPGVLSWVDRLLDVGIFVDFFSATAADAPALMNAGNSASRGDRFVLMMYAQYLLLVRDPPNLLVNNLRGDPAAFTTKWHAVEETDLGRPLEARQVYMSGLPNNCKTVYKREFQNAFVFARIRSDWNAIDNYNNPVAVPMPGNASLVPLDVNGKVGSPVAAIGLRCEEAAIMLKGGGSPRP
jgi:hypothetical protein